jgi:hypothetical protein
MHLRYLRELVDRFEIAALCDLSKTVHDQVGERYVTCLRLGQTLTRKGRSGLSKEKGGQSSD